MGGTSVAAVVAPSTIPAILEALTPAPVPPVHLAGIVKVSNILLADSPPYIDHIIRREIGRALQTEHEIAFTKTVARVSDPGTTTIRWDAIWAS